MYLGNPLLHPSNTKRHYTKRQVIEYTKCVKDPMYFIQKYVHIVHVDKGLIPFKPWDFQTDMFGKFHNNRFTICKMPRQVGKSTTVLSYMLWYILFNPEVNVAILANKLATAKILLGRLRLAYEKLPSWLQQGIVSWNKQNIELENLSKVLAAATSSTAVRGDTYNLVFLDEFAFVPQNIAEEFFSSVYPTISSGTTTKVIIVSTPNGLNMFYKMWVDAEEGRNSYVPIEVHWSAVPGRDEAWKRDTIANTSEEQFKTEFEIEFLGSTRTLISGQKLRELAYRDPQFSNQGLDIYDPPVRNHNYTMCVDTSHGKGMDYSAFVVIDHTATPYKVVAKFRDNEISPILYPTIICKVAMDYNEAGILCENNDVGYQVANSIHADIEYENLFTTTMRGRGGQKVSAGFGRTSNFGVKTTEQVKKIGCTNLKSLIESDTLTLEDFHIIAELSSFEAKGKSWCAADGHHDDLVMCLVIFGWLTTQEYWKETAQVNLRNVMYDDQMKNIEQELTPFGVIDDGLGEDVTVDDEGNVWSLIYDDQGEPITFEDQVMLDNMKDEGIWGGNQRW